MTGEKLGGGVLRTARTFDAKTGRIGSIRTTVGMVTERQEFGYTWDVLGNLTTRTDTTGATGADGTRDLTETFTYDTLNRLTSSRVGTGPKQTVTYDALGNICQYRLKIPQKCRLKIPHFQIKAWTHYSLPAVDRCRGLPGLRLGFSSRGTAWPLRLSGTRLACSRSR